MELFLIKFNKLLLKSSLPNLIDCTITSRAAISQTPETAKIYKTVSNSFLSFYFKKLSENLPTLLISTDLKTVPILSRAMLDSSKTYISLSLYTRFFRALITVYEGLVLYNIP